MEEQDVTIDGSATRDPDGDVLSYQWTLVAAPVGSGITVSANTPTFTFRPDVPGEYQLQLTASDGSASASDTMRVAADALFTVTAPGAFSIDGASVAGSDQVNLTLRTSANFSGNPVTFTATSSAPWLPAPTNGTFAAAGADVVVPLRLDLEELQRMENGEYQASVTISPTGGWAGAVANVTLDLALPLVRTVAPYVAYVGESSRVTLHGENLLKADGQSLFVGGTEALDIEATGDSHGEIDLPPLPAGTYTVRIGHALGIEREMARVVVRSPPVYQDVDGIDVSGSILSSEYDAERDAIYYVMFAPNGLNFAVRLRNDGTGLWLSDSLMTPLTFVPRALALSADGTELLISSLNCWVHRLDPDTLAILESSQKASCAEGSEFTAMAPLADERVLALESRLNGNDAVLEYPEFAPTDVLPERRGAFFVLNGHRDRLLYAQPLGEEPSTVYDIDGQSRSVQLQEHPAGVQPNNLSVSANGSRTLHATNVYDREMNLIGRLAGNRARVASTLNEEGTRAVTLDIDTNSFYVHDISTLGTEYPQIGPTAVLTDDIDHAYMVSVPPSGGAVFAMGFIPELFISRGFYRFYVRVHPELPR